MKIEEQERLATALTAKMLTVGPRGELTQTILIWRRTYELVLREFIEQEIAERNPKPKEAPKDEPGESD